MKLLIRRFELSLTRTEILILYTKLLSYKNFLPYTGISKRKNDGFCDCVCVIPHIVKQ